MFSESGRDGKDDVGSQLNRQRLFLMSASWGVERQLRSDERFLLACGKSERMMVCDEKEW